MLVLVLLLMVLVLLRESGFPGSEGEHPGFIAGAAANIPQLRADVRAFPERLPSSRRGGS